MKKYCSLMLAFALVATMASAQTVTLGTGTVVNTNAGYPAPYGNYWGGARHQYLITAAELSAAGASAGNVSGLGFDVVTVNGVPLQGFGISMGHTLQVPSAAANAAWETGLTPVYGPITHTASVGWNTHTFNAPFAWNGVDNVMIETCFNNLSYTLNCIFNQTAIGTRSVNLYRNDNTPAVCTLTGANYTGLNRPNMQITFGSAPTPDYQVNQLGAYMDFDFVLASSGAAAITNKCVGGQVNACADSMGNPADVFLNMAAVVPSSAGGIALNTSNVVNLDLSAGFVQLLGAFLPLGGASGTCPVFFGAPAGTISAQLVALDATSAIGVSLSQACQLNGVAGGSVSLLTADDASYTLDLTAAPLCRTGVPFYGTTYTQLSVSTNGIVCPGTTGQTGWTPSAANAQAGPGSVGIWSDWQSNANPAASIVVNGAGLFGGVDVTYTNVPYWGSAVTSTFNVGIDSFGPRVEGISGLGTDPTGTGIVLSMGGGLATDPGATVFALGGPFTTVTPATDMIYNIGTGSPALGGGANNIWFTSLVGGGYDWTGL